MRTLIVLPLAEADLNEIWEFIAKDNVLAANRVIGLINAEVNLLGKMPGAGHRRNDVADPTYRFRRVFSYIIADQFDDATLTVARVVHGRRDFSKLFPNP